MNRSDFLRLTVHDHIATIWLDHQVEKMNVVSPDMMGILDEVFDELKTNDDIHGAVIISAKDDFIAGADIKSFAIEQEGDFRPIQAKGHQGLKELEEGAKPVVAAVHGTAFGLGTELSLACHAIVASKHPRTKFALPEVKLGLLPGGGGTQRLPRRVGLQKALEMMTTGKNIYAHQAKKMGLVDVLTDRHKLHSAAVQLCQRMVKGEWSRTPKKKSLMNKILEDTGFGRSIVFKQARKMATKATQGNYPAVPAIIDCVQTGYEKGIDAGYEKELELFEKLMLTPESESLRWLFFAMTDNKKNPWAERVDAYPTLETLGMLGAGFMGAGITEVSVNKGIDVLLKDLNAETIQEARTAIWKGLKKKIRYKSIRPTEAEEVIGRVRPRLSYDDFDQADIVIEAVVEKMEVKKIVIDEIQQNCREDVVIASNTSSLSLTEMANHAKRPEQVIGMHYFSPVPKMPLLEIVRTEHTAPEVVAACYDFGVRQGKTVIVVKDGPGFYVNRILAPYLNECLLMADEGVALDGIDTAMKRLGFPVGPVSLLDEVGLDIAAHVASTAEEAMLDGREGFEASDATVRMFEDGRLGKKNKKGFYRYEDKKGRVKKAGIDPQAYNYFTGNGDKPLNDATIQDRGLLLMVNEAVMCMEEGIIENTADGNLGAVFGIGFLPFTGGPFRYIDQRGAANIVARMDELAETYGPKFTPRPLLRQKAEAGERFD